MRVLVTGGAGFIGSHYVRTMLADGYPGYEGAAVTVLDRLTYAGNLKNLAEVVDSPRYRFVRGDIADAQSLDAVLPGHDVVINFAAESHVDRSIARPDTFMHTNLLGTHVLFDACLRHGVGRVLHVSTDEVYGSIAEGSFTEEDPLEPNSPYSATKAGADLLARAYAVTYGLHVSVSRSTNNYGPYQYPEKIIPLFITNLLDGLRVPLYGDGMHVRDWLHVDDHCRGLQHVLDKGHPGQYYNIAGGMELSNRQLTELLLQATGRDWSSVEHVEDRVGHDRRYSLSDERVRALGYEPAITFEHGLAETVQWYRDHRDWWEPLKKQVATR